MTRLRKIGSRIHQLFMTHLSVLLAELSGLLPQLLFGISVDLTPEAAPNTRTFTVLHQEGCKNCMGYYENCWTGVLEDLVFALGSPSYIREDKSFCGSTDYREHIKVIVENRLPRPRTDNLSTSCKGRAFIRGLICERTSIRWKSKGRMFLKQLI
ncbi:hypothetical protein HanIR_Chr05g0220601 [Helianthus annuus]|nr:hypothetical protein HanIR_Chr05g0220601 [Helianthus annuus]